MTNIKCIYGMFKMYIQCICIKIYDDGRRIPASDFEINVYMHGIFGLFITKIYATVHDCRTIQSKFCRIYLRLRRQKMAGIIC